MTHEATMLMRQRVEDLRQATPIDFPQCQLAAMDDGGAASVILHIHAENYGQRDLFSIAATCLLERVITPTDMQGFLPDTPIPYAHGETVCRTVCQFAVDNPEAPDDTSMTARIHFDDVRVPLGQFEFHAIYLVEVDYRRDGVSVEGHASGAPSQQWQQERYRTARIAQAANLLVQLGYDTAMRELENARGGPEPPQAAATTSPPAFPQFGEMFDEMQEIDMDAVREVMARYTANPFTTVVSTPREEDSPIQRLMDLVPEQNAMAEAAPPDLAADAEARAADEQSADTAAVRVTPARERIGVYRCSVAGEDSEYFVDVHDENALYYRDDEGFLRPAQSAVGGVRVLVAQDTEQLFLQLESVRSPYHAAEVFRSVGGATGRVNRDDDVIGQQISPDDYQTTRDTPLRPDANRDVYREMARLMGLQPIRTNNGAGTRAFWRASHDPARDRSENGVPQFILDRIQGLQCDSADEVWGSIREATRQWFFGTSYGASPVTTLRSRSDAPPVQNISRASLARLQELQALPISAEGVDSNLLAVINDASRGQAIRHVHGLPMSPTRIGGEAAAEDAESPTDWESHAVAAMDAARARARQGHTPAPAAFDTGRPQETRHNRRIRIRPERIKHDAEDPPTGETAAGSRGEDGPGASPAGGDSQEPAEGDDPQA